MAEKYLYFRSIAADASDTDANDSVCYPASSFVGMAPGGRTTVVLRFKPLTRGTPPPSVLHADNLDNNDTVTLTVTQDTQATTMKAITNAIVGENFPSFLVIANDDSDATEYLAGSTITSCTIGTKADYADVSGTDPVVVSAAGVTLDSSTNIELNADSGTINFKDASASLGTITSAGYTGDVVGNASTATTAGTVTTAAQPAIESIGTDGDTLSILGDVINVANTTTNMPKVNIHNSTDDATGPSIYLGNIRKDGGGSLTNGANLDSCGQIGFFGQDSANQSTEFANIKGSIHDVTHTEESGRLVFEIANHDGGMGDGLILTGGSENNEIDVTIGLGAESVVTIPGQINQAGYYTAVATSDGSGTGTIPNNVSNVYAQNLSGDANYIITLPSASSGVLTFMKSIRIYFQQAVELRTDTPASVSLNGGSGSGAESAIAVVTLVDCFVKSANAWVCTQCNGVGVQTPVTPAA